MNEHIIVLEKARFTVITEHLIRCEYALNGKFCDDPTLFAVNRTHDGSFFEIKTEENHIEIKTSAIHLFYQNDGEPFSENNLYGTVYGEEWHFGKENKQNLGGTLSTLDGVDGPRPVENGLLSRDGWFVIDDSDATPIHDGWLLTRPRRFETDIYLFGYGSDYKKALHTLFHVSGKAAFPRKYVFGSWYSRWWAYTDEEILGIVDEYDEHDFPIDIMVIDMDWHHHDWTYRNTEEGNLRRAKTGYSHCSNFGWTGYSWNHRLIKDPPDMLKKLHEKGVFVTLNDHPHDGIRIHEEAYSDFMHRMGLSPESGLDVEFDAGSKKYMEAFFGSVHEKLEKDGVDFWWVDWQQDDIKPYIKGTKMRHIPWLNHCYYHHLENGGKRGLSFSRWGGFGDHKYPIHFSGDTVATWDCLKFEVEFTAMSSNVGLFYWGHDTGGFSGEPNAQMYVRWTQFCTLSACLRAHSERSAKLDRRPWKWGDEAEKAMRDCYHLRSRLMPYIYSLAYLAHAEGTPLLEPMYYEYPNVEEAYHHGGQYFFGHALLASPVTSPMNETGKAVQTVWIPEGTWYSFFTGKAYTAGTHEIACALDEFPLLVKGGIPLPMQEYTGRMTTEVLKDLQILIFPGESGEFTLYEDDGITRDFENGAYLKTKLAYINKNGKITVSITPEGNGYAGMPAERSYTMILKNTEKKLSISEGNAQISFENGKNIIRIAAQDIKSPVKIVLE